MIKAYLRANRVGL